DGREQAVHDAQRRGPDSHAVSPYCRCWFVCGFELEFHQTLFYRECVLDSNIDRVVSNKLKTDGAGGPASSAKDETGPPALEHSAITYPPGFARGWYKSGAPPLDRSI